METPKPKEKKTIIEKLRKVWHYRKHLIIEPLVVCWLLPLLLLNVAARNLVLEKACRVNLGYDAHICTSMLDKELHGIDCDAIKLQEDASEIMNNATDLVFDELPANLTSSDLNSTVCEAETETQKLVTIINGIRGPMSSVFPIVIILFAGGWSDRKGLRKPCLLFPMIGEVLSTTGLLITSIFMDVIPLEYGAIIERVIPSMLGGQTLMIMGIYSYLTEVTEENDRPFRFGIFSVVVNIITLFAVLFSGDLFILLGYVKMFIIGDCILILGIIYLIFFIPEIKQKNDADSTITGKDNRVLDGVERSVIPLEIDTKYANMTENNEKETTKKNCFTDFFDPTLAYDCVKVFLKKRDNNVRFLLIILVLSYFLFIAPVIGEDDNYYNFVQIHLKWNGQVFSYFSTYSAAISIFGTFLMTGVFIKALNMSYAMAGVIASLCTVISRPMMAFSEGSVLFYAATTVDLFVSCKAIAIKAILSVFVEGEELGRLFSVLGITEAISGLIFPALYSNIYLSTLETFPGAFYLFSEIFLIPTLILFGVTYVFLRKHNKENPEEIVENGIENEACDAGEIESTKV